MKYKFIIILINVTLLGAVENPFLFQDTRKLTVEPIQQSWKLSDSTSLSEFTLPIRFYLLLGFGNNLQLQTGYAQLQGDGLEKINGFVDTQFGYNHHFKNMNTIFNIWLNLPTGRTELDGVQYMTAFLASFNHFNFKTPAFGQGLNFTPSASWALPLSDRLVFGLGAAYQIKGAYKPILDYGEYKPGNEFIINGGCDIAINDITNLSVDIILNQYGDDKLDNEVFLKPGSRISFNLRYNQFFGFDQLQVGLRTSSKEKNKELVSGLFVQSPLKTVQDYTIINAFYKHVTTSDLQFTALFENKTFQATEFFPDIRVNNFGVLAEIPLQTVFVPILLKYQIANDGDKGFSGFEFSSGVRFEW